MNLLNDNIKNHELWYRCTKCGAWFDRIDWGMKCPECGNNNK